MRIVSQGNRLILSQPQTGAERKFLNTIHQLSVATGQSRLEFEVSSMSLEDEATHVSLEPVIPEQFTMSEVGGTIFVDRKESRCHVCGGPDH